MTTVFKLKGKPVHKDPPEGRHWREQDIPDSHVSVLRTSLADMITETDDGLRDGFTEAEYEDELEKAELLQRGICDVLDAHGCCYGTELTALLKIVAKLHFDMTDIAAEMKAAASAENAEKEKEA